MQHGDKINLATGRSGLILDVVVETGNPADAERFLPMSSATLRLMASRHAKSRATAAMPAPPTSPRPRRLA